MFARGHFLRGAKNDFNWALITTFKCGNVNMSAELAIESWLALKPRPTVLVVADCVPAKLKASVTLLPHVDTTFDGLPLFGSLLYRSIEAAARMNLSCVGWVNADMLLAPNVGQTVLLAQSAYTIPWMLLGVRHDLPPQTLNELYDRPDRLQSNVIGQFIRQRGTLHSTGGVDLFVWNQPRKPVARAPFPPFVRTANIWDNWWVSEAASSNRLVVDAGDSMTLGHIGHDRYDNNGKPIPVVKSKQVRDAGKPLSPWSVSSYLDWHNYHNRAVLSRYQRGYTLGGGVTNKIPVKVTLSRNRLLFTVSTKPQKQVVGGRRELDYTTAGMRKFVPEPSNMNAAYKGIPHTLENLLTDTSIDDAKPIVLTGAIAACVPTVMSWICNLQRLNLYQNVLVAAFDEKAYAALYMYGVAVFMANNTLAPADKIVFDHGGGSCQMATRLATAVVLELLCAGRDVLWSDSDIVVYRPFMHELLMGNSGIQLYNTNPSRGMRAHGGFYLARSRPWVIQAFSDIMAHTKTSTGTEQWNAILCRDHSLKARGCYYNGHTVAFLDRKRVAAGDSTEPWRPQQDGWDKKWGACASAVERRRVRAYTNGRRRGT